MLSISRTKTASIELKCLIQYYKGLGVKAFKWHPSGFAFDRATFQSEHPDTFLRNRRQYPVNIYLEDYL